MAKYLFQKVNVQENYTRRHNNRTFKVSCNEWLNLEVKKPPNANCRKSKKQKARVYIKIKSSARQVKTNQIFI
jgi:hypothetical protein